MGTSTHAKCPRKVSTPILFGAIMKARTGEPSTATIISAWGTPSSSGTTVYETQLHSDGWMTCNCPGWCMKKKDKHTGEPLPRTCSHIRSKLPLAQAILDGRSPKVFDKYLPENSQVVAPAPKLEGRRITFE